MIKYEVATVLRRAVKLFGYRLPIKRASWLPDRAKRARQLRQAVE
jgi:hypothetical protein